MKTFETTDYQTTIVLSALGFKLIAINKSSPRYIFQFQDDPQIPESLKKFYTGQLSLDPRLILMHSKMVKDRIHGGGF